MTSENDKLIKSITELIILFERNGDTMNNDSLNDLRKDLSTKLYHLQDVMKYTKKRWLSAELNRKSFIAQREEDLLTEKVNGKKMSQYDRKNRAFLDAREKYEEEIDAQSDYDKLRMAARGIEQVLNSISSYKTN